MHWYLQEIIYHCIRNIMSADDQHEIQVQLGQVLELVPPHICITSFSRHALSINIVLHAKVERFPPFKIFIILMKSLHALKISENHNAGETNSSASLR